MDHDQRFKILLKEFFAEFFALFFADWTERFDFAKVVWLDQEIFIDPPRGEKSVLDLVAQLPVLPAEDGPRPNEPQDAIVLVHIEIESAESIQPFRARFYEYFHDLSRRTGRQVLPIAVFLKLAMQGRGRDAHEVWLWDRCLLRFEYDYVALPGLNGEEYLSRDNILAAAWSALMRWPREKRPLAAVDAVERIVHSAESNWRKTLLAECVQAYAPLDDDQRIELDDLLQQPERGVLPMIKTWTEQGWEQGLEQGMGRGRVEGQRRLLELQLQSLFGDLGDDVRRRLEMLNADELDRLALALIRAKSLSELGLRD